MARPEELPLLIVSGPGVEEPAAPVRVYTSYGSVYLRTELGPQLRPFDIIMDAEAAVAVATAMLEEARRLLRTEREYRALREGVERG